MFCHINRLYRFITKIKPLAAFCTPAVVVNLIITEHKTLPYSLVHLNECIMCAGHGHTINTIPPFSNPLDACSRARAWGGGVERILSLSSWWIAIFTYKYNFEIRTNLFRARPCGVVMLKYVIVSKLTRHASKNYFVNFLLVAIWMSTCPYGIVVTVSLSNQSVVRSFHVKVHPARSGGWYSSPLHSGNSVS